MRHRAARSLIAAAICWLLATPPAGAGPALLYDAQTRQVLYAEDVDHPWFPASLTKMMTAYVVFEAWKKGQADRTADIAISARANSRPRMRLGLGVGKSITFDEAMAALIIHSANDIAVALAEAVSGSEAAFVEAMNATAKRLGMASTHFINANGLPGEGQQSTARDLATLTQALFRDFPEHAGLFALTEAPIGQRTVTTHNPVLVRLPGGDGIKTGFTCSAGYNIVGSATREGTTLVAIVLGEQTPLRREVRVAALLEHGFRTLEWKAIFPPVTLDRLPVEAFDAAQVRAANLDKRYKDCLAPEAELDADGNPICPDPKVVKTIRVGRGGRGKMMVAPHGESKALRQLPEVCAKLIADKQKKPGSAKDKGQATAPTQKRAAAVRTPAAAGSVVIRAAPP